MLTTAAHVLGWGGRGSRRGEQGGGKQYPRWQPLEKQRAGRHNREQLQRLTCH